MHRADSSQSIAQYELNTVTYGTGPASYLATKCLQVVANEIEPDQPHAAAVIKQDFYMDDLMTGSNSIEEAKQLQSTVHRALASAKFPLRKYQSNSEEFLSALDPLLVEKTNSRLLGNESFVHVLSLMWFTRNDYFRVVLNFKPLPSIIN